MQIHLGMWQQYPACAAMSYAMLQFFIVVQPCLVLTAFLHEFVVNMHK